MSTGVKKHFKNEFGRPIVAFVGKTNVEGVAGVEMVPKSSTSTMSNMITWTEAEVLRDLLTTTLRKRMQ